MRHQTKSNNGGTPKNSHPHHIFRAPSGKKRRKQGPETKHSAKRVAGGLRRQRELKRGVPKEILMKKKVERKSLDGWGGVHFVQHVRTRFPQREKLARRRTANWGGTWTQGKKRSLSRTVGGIGWKKRGSEPGETARRARHRPQEVVCKKKGKC